MRVLLVAPTIDGDDVGESWVAYQWAQLLAARHQLTVVTYHKRGHRSVADQLAGTRVVEWGEPPFLGRYERFNSMLHPAYPWFYVKARHWIRGALASGEHFDVAHQPAPVALRYPSPACGLSIPLIMGPVGGSLSTPIGFEADDTTTPWFVKLRAIDSWRLSHDRLLRRTYREASCVLGIAPYVEDNLSPVPLRRFEVMSDTGLTSMPKIRSRPPVPGSPLKLLYAGRLVRTKGIRELLRALGELSDLALHLDILGEGPERSLCESLVSELRICHRVSFHGSVPRNIVNAFYESADVFVFPSYREPGGSVVFEAMGYGLPLIVADRGGPASNTNSECAIRLPISTPEALVADLASAIRTLASDSSLRESMGRAARERVQQIGLWQTKIDQIDSLYKSVMLK